MSERSVPVGKLVLWPAAIALAVTLLRLVGELLDWSPRFFSREPGGGGAIVGISWLPAVFGIVFAIQLVRAGFGPRSGLKAIGLALLGLAVPFGALNVAARAGLIQPGTFTVSGLLVLTLIMIAGGALAWTGWPELGRTLLAYAVASRVPVALLMLVAMLGDWKTHYDLAPPDFPQMSVLSKWLLIGLLPQLTTWLGITVAFGAVFGSIAGTIAARRAAAG